MSTPPKLVSTHRDPNSYPPGVAFMDGQYLPISEAKISVLDYGFLHSDATYDVVHVWKGAFFRLDQHLDRFFAGMQKLHLSIPHSRQEIVDILQNCVGLSQLQNAYVELICTRGTSPTFSRDPRHCANRFIAFAIPFGSVAGPDQLERGLHAAITTTVRIPPQSVDPTIKNYHWLDMVNSLYAAYDAGAETAFLIDERGNLSEGPGFNIFIVRNGSLQTPTRSVLQGITRQTVFALCSLNSIPCRATDVSPAMLLEADEVFITSTAGGIMPVCRVNSQNIGSGLPGPITKKLKELYWQLHEKDMHRLLVRYEKFTRVT